MRLPVSGHTETSQLTPQTVPNSALEEAEGCFKNKQGHLQGLCFVKVRADDRCKHLSMLWAHTVGTLHRHKVKVQDRFTVQTKLM